MNDHSIDPERAALVTKRMAQAFAFARDVIDAPSILEEIPDGSTLLFRDAEFQGEQIRLTAHPAQDRPGWWTARVTGPARLAAESDHGELPTEGEGRRSNPRMFLNHGPTAKDALDALEEQLCHVDRPRVMARHASGR